MSKKGKILKQKSEKKQTRENKQQKTQFKKIESREQKQRQNSHTKVSASSRTLATRCQPCLLHLWVQRSASLSQWVYDPRCFFAVSNRWLALTSVFLPTSRFEMYHFVAMLRRCVRVDHYQQVGWAPCVWRLEQPHQMFRDLNASMGTPWKQTVKRWRSDFLSIPSKQFVIFCKTRR